ncbi:MAG: hypothetical protein E7551_02495 [Ruminococcaceae bacterium]|nr:hypothetical protein [Oscillospiraceae bacterium]
MAGENAVKPKGIKAKIENFWYHYKYHSIAIFIVFITIAVSLAQCAFKTDYDLKIIVATRSMTLSTPQIEAITNELNRYGTDVNGDGEVNILLVDCTIDGNTSDYQTLLGKQQKLQALLMTDIEAMLFLTDNECLEWIDSLNEETHFIEDTGLPHNNGRGFLVSDTHIIQNPKKTVDAEKGLLWPDDLSICRRKIKGTAFEEKEGIEKATQQADAFIGRIMESNKK